MNPGDQFLHEMYMRRCFQLAKKARSGVRTNPLVGAVIVHGNQVIGEGYHKEFGKAHAEINAINSVQTIDQQKLAHADLYVTLEPCSHQGQTPPCVDAIIKHRIKRVFISAFDPNPKVSGSGIRKLKEAGIKVYEGILEEEGKELLSPFLKNIMYHRPYIILKYAQSHYGYMGKVDESVWFTNQYSRLLVHKWRSEANALLVGTKTALMDNPRLDIRYGFPGSILRILIDKELVVPRSHRFYNEKGNKLVMTHQTADEENGLTIVKINPDEDIIDALIKELGNRDIGSLIVEGGAQTIMRFVEKDLWDEARIFRTKSKLQDGIRAPRLSGLLIKKAKISGDELLIIKNNKSRS